MFGMCYVFVVCCEYGVVKLVFMSMFSVVYGGDSVDGVDESVFYLEYFEVYYLVIKVLVE